MGLLGWDQDTPGDKTQRGVVSISFLMIFGMFLCSIALAQSVPKKNDVSELGVGLTAFLLFGAAAAVGAGIGFLFGLPRSRYADGGATGQTSTEARAGGMPGAVPRSAHYLTNSNLIKVSDWLTTIIIGVGLVNLVKIGPAVGDLSNTLADALGGAAYAGVVGVSVIVIAVMSSIILCYLWTSVRVRELLEESENRLTDGTPALIGQTVRDAKVLLGETRLKLETNGASDDDRITTQQPAPGTPALIGSGVTIQTAATSHSTVATGPD